MRLSRLPRLFLVSVLAVVALIPAAVAASPKPAASCTNIAEFATGITSDFEVNEDGAFVWILAESDDVLGGKLKGQQDINKITPPGGHHFTGYNYYTGTEYGDFEAVTKGQTTPHGKLSFTITIVAGDATGKLTAHGYWDGVTGEWEALYKGRICS